MLGIRSFRRGQWHWLLILAPPISEERLLRPTWHAEHVTPAAATSSLSLQHSAAQNIGIDVSQRSLQSYQRRFIPSHIVLGLDLTETVTPPFLRHFFCLRETHLSFSNPTSSQLHAHDRLCTSTIEPTILGYALLTPRRSNDRRLFFSVRKVEHESCIAG